MCILGLTQMAVSWVWGVRGGQIFFCYELWTHWDPLGVRPAPKSICTHQSHPLKLVVPKMAQNQHFGTQGMAPPDGPKYLPRSNFALRGSIESSLTHLIKPNPLWTSYTTLTNNRKNRFFGSEGFLTQTWVNTPKIVIFQAKTCSHTSIITDHMFHSKLLGVH